MASFSCSIDQIHFSIQKLDNRFTLIENFNGVTHDASFSRDGIAWLFEEIKKISTASEVGHLGRLKNSESTISLSIRMNSLGLFVALMVVDKRSEKKVTTICIPVGQEGSGIISFSSFLGKVLSKESQVHQAKKVSYLFQSEEEAMRATCVIATFSSDSYDWNLLPGDLLDMLDIVRAPPIEPIGGRTFLLTFDSSKEVELIMSTEEMILWDCKVSFEKWRPELGTLSNSTLQCSTRWITMYGLPCHLRNKFFISKLCKGFGKVADIKSTRGRLSNLTALQVCFENCDLTLMPQIIPVKDKGSIFPITLSPFMPEFKCIMEDQDQDKFIGKSTQVEVPTSQSPKTKASILENKKVKASSSSNHSQVPGNPKKPSSYIAHPLKSKKKVSNHHSSASTEPAYYHKPTPSYSPRFPNHLTTLSPPKHHIIESSTEDDDDLVVSVETNSHSQNSFDDLDSSTSDMVQMASTLGMSLQAADYVFKRMVELKRELLSEMDTKFNKGMEDLIEALGAYGVNEE